MTEATPSKPSLMDRFLTIRERSGNELPHPTARIALLALTVVTASWRASMAGLRVAHPSTGESVTPLKLLTAQVTAPERRDGVHLMSYFAAPAAAG